MHRVTGLTDPTTDNLCRDVLRRIGREGRNRGRGQVAGLGWAQAEAAAARAKSSDTLQGLRDGAIIRLMSDTLARVSEVAGLQCIDVEPDPTAGRRHRAHQGEQGPTSMGTASRATSGRTRWPR